MRSTDYFNTLGFVPGRARSIGRRRIRRAAMLLAAASWSVSALAELSPLDTIEALHKAMREGDAATAEKLLHSEYRGWSFYGPVEGKRVQMETREKAVSDVKKLKPGEWEVRFLKTAVDVDSNGMAHVWAYYVFYLNGEVNHCGYESYVLFHFADGWKVMSFADTDNLLHAKSVAERCPEAVRSSR